MEVGDLPRMDRVTFSQRSYPNFAVVTHVLNDGKLGVVIRPSAKFRAI